jgi:hypothetical protein
LDRKEALFTYLLAVAGSWIALLIGLVINQQYASVFGIYALEMGAIVAIVAGLLGVLVYTRWPNITAYFKRFDRSKLVRVKITPARATQMAIDAAADAFDLKIENPHITSMKKEKAYDREHYEFKGKGVANGINRSFRGVVDGEGKGVTIVLDPLCRVCGQPMVLLDEERRQWYCYKDDELRRML